ncbi:MAG: AMP-binding protein [Deltaproteobacteria bacterium]|nr:AMP-binding protein [Deltaproteobacteria bacterium]
MYEYEKPDNLVALWENSVAKHPNNKIFGTKSKQGVYEWLTYREVDKMINDLRAGLALLGINKGGVVGIIANNRYEWVLAAFATYGREARFIPMYEQELLRIWKYIITDGGVEVLLVANEGIYEKVKGFIGEIPTLKHILVIDSDREYSLAALMKRGAETPVSSSQPSPYDVAGLIYTSGTTGEPKGVLLSHGNFTSNLIAGIKKYPHLDENTVTLAILPWAHSYAQTGELYAMIHLGARMGLVENTNTIANDIALVKPTWLIAVPRVFNKIYEGITTKMRNEGGLAKKLFDMGINSAKKKRELSKEGRKETITNIKFAIADKIVFGKIREKLGGRLTGSMTASAMMNREVAQFFFDIGIPVYDCYGMTESSPAIAMNASYNYRMGSVGTAIERLKIVIDKTLTGADSRDGEIVVYGPNIMIGYHNKPEQTKEVLTADGGLRTGDRGYLDEDGFLFITGRIKEQYKLENGKFVFPASLEEDIALVPYVLNVLIHGENRAYNVCLIVPNFDNLQAFLKEKGLTGDKETLAKNKLLVDFIANEINKSLAEKYGAYEIPKKYALVAEPFSVDNGLLTQTLKLKRKVVFERFKGTIEGLYS